MSMRLLRPGFRFWLALLVIVLGALLTFLDPRDVMLPSPIPEGSEDTPDYIVEGVRLTRFDETGQPYQHMESPRVTHTAGNITHLERPVAHLIDEDQRTWVASALSGTLRSKQDLLMLEGQARLFAPEERWQLDTHTLYYNSNEAHIWSDDYSVLRQPPQRMTGYRFDAWLDDNSATLTDNVRGYHPPATPET